METTILDPIRQMIFTYARLRGIALNELSRRSGKHSAYIHQFLYRGTPKELPERIRYRVAALLGLDEYQLRVDEGIAPPAPQLVPVLPARVPGQLTQPKPTAETAKCPHLLASVDGAFAVRISDELMIPRYQKGDLAYFHPGQMPREGDTAVIETKSGERVVGVLAGYTSKEIVLARVRVPHRERFLRSRVTLIAREIGVFRRDSTDSG